MTVTAPTTLPLDVALQQAVAHHQAGRLPEAEDIYRAILQALPDHPDANHNLGLLACQVGQHAGGLPHLKAALDANPAREQYWLSYAGALLATDRAKEAPDILQDAIRRGIDGPAIRTLLKKAGAAAPGGAARGDAPAPAEIERLVALFDAGRHAELESRARSLLERYPESGIAWKALGISLQMQGKDALYALHKTVELLPDDAEAHSNLGKSLRDIGQLDNAAASCLRALEIKPDFAEAHSNLGNALQDLGQLDSAVASFRRALEIKPDSAGAHRNLGNALRHQVKLTGALESYGNALALKPDDADTYNNLLFTHAYHCLGDPAAYLVLARGWEQACVPEAERQAARSRSFRRAPLTGRRLRVGYVSGDFRQHAVSYFIEQLFARHDRTKIELFAYSAHINRDVVTARLRTLAEHWVNVAGMGDAAVRERIGTDAIDVLIDLSGHTHDNRLGVFARRAAPVQAHYLGFFASTGLTEMDYWIGDEILTPPATDDHFSEQVWRLPRVWVSYEDKAEAPIPDWRPAEDGAVWLGSFNNLGKLTSATLALWARVLHALPRGRLLLKTRNLDDVGCRQSILGGFAAHGIASARIELQDSNITPTWSEHMACYNRLDIALDPVGAVGGGTTTCDALWMAVPMITLAGDRMASRMTASMLAAIGHPEWIAQSEAEYIDKVVALAHDVDRRKALRTRQRAEMAASPLCNARDLAMNLEQAYVAMFQRWLAQQNRPSENV